MTRLLADVLFIVFGKYGQYVVTLVTVPLTARTLGPEGTGLLAIATSAYFFGSVVTDLGVTQVLAAQVPNHTALPRLRSAFVAIRLSITVVLASSFLIAFALQASPWVAMALLGLLVGSLSSLGEEWVLTGRGQFGRIAIFQMSARIVYLASLVLLLPLAPEPWVPLALLALGNAIGSLLSWISLRREGLSPHISSEYRNILRLGWPVLTSRLLTTTYGQGASLVYSSAIPPLGIGIFSASDRLVRAAQSATDAFGLAMLPRLAKVGGSQTFWARTAASSVSILLGSTVVAGIITASGPWIISLLYGDQFIAAIPVIQSQAWLLPAAALTNLIYSSVLSVLQDTRGMLFGTIMGATTTVCAIIVAVQTSSLWTAVWGSLLSEWIVAIWALGRTFWHWRRYRHRAEHQS